MVIYMLYVFDLLDILECIELNFFIFDVFKKKILFNVDYKILKV